MNSCLYGSIVVNVSEVMIVIAFLIVSFFCGCCNVPLDNQPKVIWTSKSGSDGFGEISEIKFSNAGVWSVFGDKHIFSGKSVIGLGEHYEMKLMIPVGCKVSHFSVHPEYSVAIRRKVNQYMDNPVLESINIESNNVLHVIMKPGPARVQYWSVGFK